MTQARSLRVKFALFTAMVATLFATMALSATPATADTGTCATTATKDAWVDKANRTTPQPNTSPLKVNVKGTTLKYAHFAFDVACIPSGATITGARVEVTPAVTANNVDVRVWKTTSASWGETTIHWDNQPLDVANTNSMNRVNHTAGTAETYDLPAAGRPTANGLIAYRLRDTAFQNNKPELHVNSREAASGQPRLLVDWEGTAPTTTTTTTTAPPSGCPEGSINVGVADSLQNKLDTNGPGTFCLANGVHRDGGVTSGVGDVIVGESLSAVMDGSKEVTNWVQDGSFWKSTGQTFNPTVWTYALGGHEECQAHPENCHMVDLFKNGSRLTRVLDNANLGPGKWNFDYANDTIWLGENPGTATFETSQYKNGIHAEGSTLRGFTAQKYAGGDVSNGSVGCLPQRHGAAIAIVERSSLCGTATAGLAENLVVQLNHDTGIRIAKSTVRDTRILHNGRYGMNGGGGIIEGTSDPRSTGSGPMEIGWNNELDFRTTGDWAGAYDAGATKFGTFQSMTVRNVWSHHNLGPGLWWDVCWMHLTAEQNLVETNDGGISVELPWHQKGDANTPCWGWDGPTQNSLVRNNVSRGNKGDGINVSSATNVEVYGNVIDLYDGSRGAPNDNPAVTQGPRGIYLYLDGRQVEHDISIHDNDITWHPLDPAIWPHKAHPFGITGEGDLVPSITIESNDYHVPTANQGEALWQYGWGNFETWTQWRAHGFDSPDGTLGT